MALLINPAILFKNRKKEKTISHLAFPASLSLAMYFLLGSGLIDVELMVLAAMDKVFGQFWDLPTH